MDKQNDLISINRTYFRFIYFKEIKKNVNDKYKFQFQFEIYMF